MIATTKHRASLAVRWRWLRARLPTPRVVARRALLAVAFIACAAVEMAVVVAVLGFIGAVLAGG